MYKRQEYEKFCHTGTPAKVRINANNADYDIIFNRPDPVQERISNPAGKQRPIRLFHPDERDITPVPPVIPPHKFPDVMIASKTRRDAFHSNYGNWPRQGNFSDKLLNGTWTGGTIPIELARGHPDRSVFDAGTAGDNLMKQLFKWRPLPYPMDIASRYTFVDYYKLKYAEYNMDTVITSAISYGNHHNVKVKCSVLFHATPMRNIPDIISSGFTWLYTQGSGFAGSGAYFSVYPYASYSMGDNCTGANYFRADSNGYGALIVFVGAVLPNEYTYERSSHDTKRPGTGRSSVSRQTQVPTPGQNEWGLTGGNFLEKAIQPDGTFGPNNERCFRESMFWERTIAEGMLKPIGIAIFKR